MKKGSITQKKTLAERALLVTVNISQWSGRKMDKKATEAANIAHKADASAGAYHKKLLPGAKELEYISALASQARTYFHEQTLPWLSDGTRIISGKNYINFQTGMRKIKEDFDTAVKNFQAAYPKLKMDAVQRLGGLYDAEEYPEDIADKFGINIEFFPIPEAKDFRIDIGNEERKKFEKRLKEVEGKAMQDAAKRLLEVVKNAAERLQQPGAVFRDSLLDNISEIASLIPAINITNDPTLDELAQEAKDLISGYTPNDLRKDSKKRDAARAALSKIESKMGAFMGM